MTLPFATNLMAYRIDVHKNQVNLKQEYVLSWNGEQFGLDIMEWRTTWFGDNEMENHLL